MILSGGKYTAFFGNIVLFLCQVLAKGAPKRHIALPKEALWLSQEPLELAKEGFGRPGCFSCREVKTDIAK